MTSCWRFLYPLLGNSQTLLEEEIKEGDEKMNGRRAEKHITASPWRVANATDLLLSCVQPCICVCVCPFSFMLQPFSLSSSHFHSTVPTKHMHSRAQTLVLLSYRLRLSSQICLYIMCVCSELAPLPPFSNQGRVKISCPPTPPHPYLLEHHHYSTYVPSNLQSRGNA